MLEIDCVEGLFGSRQFNEWCPSYEGCLIYDDSDGSFAIFQPYRISDHSPCVLHIPTDLNMDGCNMYQVVKRLKGLKSPFRKLLHTQGNLHNRVDHLRKELDETQKAIDNDPHNPNLHEEHAHYLLAFKEASLDEDRFLR
ncbi:hypothetical protein Tco_1132969 [Tanacetum coccineum]|uniref:Uncharacterized protein n=1 Tax=Tanacetum coccineum TaxID=301880 RepID=A0ABQ5JGA8_9ASTR